MKRPFCPALVCAFASALTLLAVHPTIVFAQQPSAPRRSVGVAFGGGSARGFAHVGVIRWFEEHRVPIDLVAGTSMGGLIGGAFSSGLSSEELERLLVDTDWNEMFGSSAYRFKNIRRKQDARDFPANLEFGLKKGLSLPPSLNNGQQVNLLLTRLMIAYSGLPSFADLPTPFRCVAVDLLTADQVVLDHGSLAQALRATMSLPGVFPPVEIDNHVLVDGGAMNNVPADVVRSMGADVVVAINVSASSDAASVNYSLFGLVGGTVDAMMLASTRRGMAQADILLTPRLEGFRSLDWRRAHDLIEAGYQAAEAVKAQLEPLALDEAGWQQYLAARTAKRRTTILQPTAVVVTGASKADEQRIQRLVEQRLGKPVDAAAIQQDIDLLSGLDAYETVDWELLEQDGQRVLAIRAKPKPYAPPFLMFSTNLQNTTSDDFSFQLAARYLAYDVLTPRSELRIDVGIGTNPKVGAEWFQPIGRSPLFVALTGAARKQRFNFVSDDVTVAQYDETNVFGQLDAGVQIGRDADARVGFRTGHLDAGLRVGDPILPSISGTENELLFSARYDGQDSQVIPSTGLRVAGTIRHVLAAPDLPPDFMSTRTNDDLTQGEMQASVFKSVWHRRDRVFVNASAGTSFGGHPLPVDQYPLGYPLRLGAFNIGERRGDNFYAVAGGYLAGIGRLPDFIGGPVFAGGWVENGSAFDKWSTSEVKTQLSLGLIIQTLLGPIFAGTSTGFDGNRRYYIGIGRLFP